MCGICGFTGEPDEGALQRMTGRLRHRGPDEDGFYSDREASLGIRRLSIIDPATGQQPIHNEDRTVWSVTNGEVYNFQELRAQLAAKGHRFYTDHSDAEVIVHLYEEYGVSFASRINGMFAAAIWDAARHELLLIRDRMGVKPLFYSRAGARVIFASEIKAILEYPGRAREANYEALYHYFSFKNIPAPLTAFAGIYSLLPGELIVVKEGSLRSERWWKIRFAEDDRCDEGEAQRRILELLEDAVRLRMISDVPFGAYLSGGVDSSAVVALMSRFSDRPIRTFSLGYEDELKNKEADLYHARRVARAYRTDHSEYIMTCQELVEDLPAVIASFDQPFSGTVSTFFLTKLIKQHVKVALSGDGADELFGSYLSHRLARPMQRYRELIAAAGRTGQGRLEEEFGLSSSDVRQVQDLFAKSSGDEALWRYRLYVSSDEEKAGLLGPAFRPYTAAASTLRLVEKNFSGLTAADPLNRILEMEWNTQLPDQVLAFVDFLSMAHSVEIRSPFLDYRLVEFAATIPGRLKINRGSVKEILKQSVAGLLPEGITERPKEGFVLPVFEWLGSRMKGYAQATLSGARLKKHGLLNPEAVSGILNDFYAGRLQNAARLWNLMMFQLWWEEYFG